MPKLPGINHLRVIQAFEKAGFEVIRQGKHITMTNGDRIFPNILQLSLACGFSLISKSN